MLVAEFGGFFEALLLKGNGADLAQKTKFTEANGAVGEGLVFDTADDGEGDSQIDPGLVDGQTAGDIDENVLCSQRKFEMFGQNSTDELKAVDGDTFGDAAGNGDGAFDDESLDFGGHGAGALHNQSQN